MSAKSQSLPRDEAGHHAGDLPVQLTSFVGRGADLAEIRALVRADRLVTLTGSGGCGKTRLALEVAASLAGESSHGAWLVELAPLTDSWQVPGAVAAALPVRRHASIDTPGTLAAAVGKRDLLVLLDNCEHVLPGCAEIAESLLRRCPGVRVLATSREPLAVPGEITWRVPSLSFPDRVSLVSVAELAKFEAVRLFADRASGARPGFSLSERNAASVAEICARLDGIPLAIELAAARVRVLSVAQITAALDHRLGLLTGGARTAVPRQQTLEASIEWSYGLLGDQERGLLQHLATFAGGFTTEAAEAVCSSGGIDASQVLHLVIQLADKSLIQPSADGSDEARFRMLESIREYAARQLEASGQARQARQRHFGFFYRYSQRRPGEPDEAHRERLQADAANLRRALEWAADHDDPRLLELATRMVPYWAVSTQLADAQQWLQTALDRSEAADLGLRARALGGLARIAGLAYDFPTAQAAGAESLGMLRQLGDKPGIVQALTSLGFIAAPLAEPGSGHAYLTEAAALAEQLGDQAAQAYALALIGRAAINRPADRPAARTALRRSIQLARECGDRRTQGTALGELGILSALDCDPARALPLLDQAMPLLQAHGDTFFHSLALVGQAQCLALRGELEGAQAACQQLDEITGELGPASLYYAAYARGWTAFCRGDWPEAICAFREQLTYPGPVGLAGTWTGNLAWAELIAGQPDGARRRVDAFLASSDVARTCPALPLAIRALIARADGDLRNARDLVHRALLASPGDPFTRLTIWTCLTITAAISADLGDHQRAARLAGAAGGFARSIEMAALPAATALLNHAHQTCREALGADLCAAALADGEAMTLTDAVSYATRGRGARHRPEMGWDSLTPTELKVAAAVADGLSNPQIAARMFIARRTVTTHLTSIFRKLGISARTELAATATRHDQHRAPRPTARSTDCPPADRNYSQGRRPDAGHPD
jgi:predicted ATPase/DNA-binding CsgD family transcriptional regulator